MNSSLYRVLVFTLLSGMLQGCEGVEPRSAKFINDQPDSPLADEYVSAIAKGSELRPSALSTLNCKVRVVSAVKGFGIGNGEPARTRVYFLLVREDGKLLHADSCGGSPLECTSIIESRARAVCSPN